MPELLRESHSDILDDADDAKSIARILQANDHQPGLESTLDNCHVVSAAEDEAKVLFAYSSLDTKPPVLIDFSNPFQANPLHRRTSNAAALFPHRNRSDSVASTTSIPSVCLGDRGSLSRTSSFSTSPVMRKGSLNPWAAPFPLPKTATPARDTSPSLPLSRAVPLSLPARPGPPPPVFVKKESATLPQPMALPTVKPMGADWLHEASLSGNERRRRASEIGAVPVMRLGQSFSVSKPAIVHDARFGSQSTGSERPERLVKLGQSLRQSVAVKGTKA
jgi:hypothetical protein